MSEHLPKIAEIITTLRRVPHAIEESNPIDALGLDELDRVCIAVELEEAFDIDVPDAELESWQTVGDVCATVERLCGEAV